jgi:predicted NBD/HSP70 family sugar kinase
MAAHLRTLWDEHDAWQQADNDLRSEQAQLSLGLDRFSRRWKRTLARKLQELCDATKDEWAWNLAVGIARMEAALSPDATVDPMDAFYDCRSAVIQRFNQVDHDLKTLCDLLKEAGGPLDTMLDGLA